MKIALRLLLMALGLLIGAVVLEAGLRCRTAYDNRRVQLAMGKNPSGEVQMGEIVRFIPNRRLVYGFRPQLEVKFQGEPLQTNKEGFRDGDHPLETPAGKRRVRQGDPLLAPGEE